MGTFVDSKVSEPERVVLRREATAQDSRYLDASYAVSGGLVISGQDIGRSVLEFLQCREYEWSYTIPLGQLETLAAALGVRENILGALQLWFMREPNANVEQLLDANKIAFEFWSHLGD